MTPKYTVITAEFLRANMPLDAAPLRPRFGPHTRTDSSVDFAIFLTRARSTDALLIFVRVNAECRAFDPLYDCFNRSLYFGSCMCFKVVARIFSIVSLLCFPPLFHGTFPAFALPILFLRNCSTLVMSLNEPTSLRVSNSPSLIFRTVIGLPW